MSGTFWDEEEESFFEEMIRTIEDNPALKNELQRELEMTMQDMFDQMERKSHDPIPDPPPAGKEDSCIFRNVEDADAFARKHPDDKIPVKKGEFTFRDLLDKLDTKERYDYCKYLHEYKKLSLPDDEKVELIWENFRKHPVVFLYPLDVTQAEELLGIPKQITAGGSCSTRCMAILSALCLARFNTKDCVLETVSDLSEILAGITPNDVKKWKRLMKKFDPAFRTLMLHYGLIEFDELPDMMEKYFSLKLTETTCSQIVYWRYSFTQKIVTCSLPREGRHFMAVPGLDLENIFLRLDVSDFMIPYWDISDNMIHAWGRSTDYLEVISNWQYLYGMLILSGSVKKEDARDICDQMYEMVRNGTGLKECMDFLSGPVEQNKNLPIRMRIWEICIRCLLTTPLPGLKGATRIETVNVPAYTVVMDTHFVDNPVREERIKKRTHIEEMDTRLQAHLCSMLATIEESDLEQLKEFLDRHASNIDLNYVYALACQRLGHKEEAVAYYRKVIKLQKIEDPMMDGVIQLCINGDPGRLVALSESGFLMM